MFILHILSSASARTTSTSPFSTTPPPPRPHPPPLPLIRSPHEPYQSVWSWLSSSSSSPHGPTWRPPKASTSLSSTKVTPDQPAAVSTFSSTPTTRRSSSRLRLRRAPPLPNQLHPRRPIRRVTLLLSPLNYTNYFITHHFSDDVTLEVNSEIMEEDDVRAAMKTVVLWGMARAWLWDGQGQAPEQLVDGMADCITAMAGTWLIESGYYSEYFPSSAEAVEEPEDDCWEGEEEGRVAGFSTARSCDRGSSQG